MGGRKIPVRIIYSDYQSATPKGVQATELLITQEKVQAVFSPFGSGAAKAGSSVAERYKVPMIAPTASSVEVYDQGYKYLFGTFTPNSTLTEPLATLITAKKPGDQEGRDPVAQRPPAIVAGERDAQVGREPRNEHRL